MTRLACALFTAALVIVPHGARAADLVLWWDEGFYPQEDEAFKRGHCRL
jgi:hypothetical protein